MDKVKNPRYRHNAITSLANVAVPLIHDMVTLPPISLHLMDDLPPVPGVVPPYMPLKLRPKQLLLSDWSATPAPSYCPYLPSTHSHPFMGLGKFIAGRIHQMHSGKGYLAAHPSWENPNADTSCSLCARAPQICEHAILSCPWSARQRSRLLQGVSDLASEAPLWSDQQLLIPLTELIRTSATGFPSGMPPLARSRHTPLDPLFPSTSQSAPGPRD